MNFLRWFANIFGNMLIFVPLGFYLPLCFPRMRRFAASLIIIVGSSISLEVLQYVLGTGSSDIDDLLLNTAGGCVGYGMYLILSRTTPTRIAALSLALVISFGFATAGDEATIYKILTSGRGSALFAVSTKIEETFRITPDTVFYKRRILQGGRQVHVAAGSRNDFVVNAMVDIWGRTQDGVLVAEVVCINTFK